MIKTLKDSKAKLSELVGAAAAGEDILITVKGQPKARLIGVAWPAEKSSTKDWAARLQSLQTQFSTSSLSESSEILNELRKDRW